MRPPRARPRGDGYHHGDLRTALLRATLALVKRGGWQAVTLRAVAAQAGVSEAAPYHHFAGKSALLAAAAAEGFRTLDRHLEEAIEAAGEDRLERVIGAAAGYVRFAYAEPGAFRLLFGAHVVELDLASDPGTRAAGRATKQRVRTAIAGFVAANGGHADTETLFRLVWAQVHGVAWLGVEREFETEFPVERAVLLAREGVRRLLAGG